MDDVANRLQVGEGKSPDDAEPRQRGGWFGDTIVSELHGKYFEHMARGRLFIYSSAAAGITFAAPGNNLPTIWNPSGSGKLFVPVRVLVGYVSGTHAAGHLAWAKQNNVGSSLGTAAPFSVFTDITPVNALIGNGKNTGLRFSTTQTWTTAPTYLRNVGISTAAMAALTAVAPWSMMWEEDGTLGIPPGNALQLAANAAIVMVASVAILGLELPLPPGWDA